MEDISSNETSIFHLESFKYFAAITTIQFIPELTGRNRENKRINYKLKFRRNLYGF